MHLTGFLTILIFLCAILMLIRVVGRILAGMEGNKEEGAGGASPSTFSGFFTSGSRNEAWMEVAHEYGLEYVRPNGMAGFPSLRGDVKERLTEVHIQISDSGVSQTLATVMFTRPLDAGILIVLDDDAVRTERFAGRKTYRIAGLDNPRLQISAPSPEALKRFLTPARMNALKNALAFYRFFEISDRYVVVKFNGDGRDPEVLSSLVEFTSSFAALLEEPESPSDSRSSDPIPVEPSEPLPERKYPAAASSEERPLSPHPEPVKTAPEPPVEPPLPETQTGAEVQENTEEPLKQEKPESLKQPETAESPEPEGLDQTAFVTSLFSASFPGKREQEIFQAAKGRRVEWNGILRSAYPFGNDFVLGPGPAVKATFEIAEVTDAYSMKSKIRATVRLPGDSIALLKNHQGEPFRFSGVLEKMEPYAREIILLDGQLL